MIQVLATKRYFEQDIHYLKGGLLPDVRLVVPEVYAEDSLAELAGDADVFLGSLVSEQMLRAAKKLKLFQVPWSGVDTLNMDLLRRFRVTVCNSHSNAWVVAEYTLGLFLAAVKQIPYHDRWLREGEWCRPGISAASKVVPPDAVRGSKVLIWGYGAIGQAVAGLLQGFSPEITICTRHIPPNLPGYIGRALTPDKLDSFLPDADYIFLCLPLTEHTRGVVDAQLLGRLSEKAVLINVSRGEIVDEAALFAALRDRRIRGAAIDTWYNYPTVSTPLCFPSKHCRFEELDNLVMSPHRAGFLRGSLPHLDDAIENINRLASGRPLINVVDMGV